jgi:hypothetical protein
MERRRKRLDEKSMKRVEVEECEGNEDREGNDRENGGRLVK